jgi:DNA-binding MarR family transcriptional regulator
MACLGLVHVKGLATPSELARYTGLTSGATTAMLDRLEKAHLIERRPNPHDRRGTLIVLTTERNHELEAIYGPGREAINKKISTYSESELELLADYFGTHVRVWEEERAKLLERYHLVLKGKSLQLFPDSNMDRAGPDEQ